MKLHRFTAVNNHQAMKKIHDTLGPDALIYSTRSIEHGVEIVAGLPGSEQEAGDHTTFIGEIPNAHMHTQAAPFLMQANDRELIEKLSAQVKLLDENIKSLTRNMQHNLHDMPPQNTPDQTIKKNTVLSHLHKMGFSNPTFCQQFISQYLRTRKSLEKINDISIGNALLKHISMHAMEFIDDKMICALIGPTGSGKTTTIAKLAKRYISRYGRDSIGLIAADYDDVLTKHQLLHYSELFGVDFEYANNKNELAVAIDNMKQKNLILIDTYGVGQRNENTLNALLELVESQGNKISTYLTIPCNLQETVLDQVVKAFKTRNLNGCILTKQDECITLAQALSVSMQHKISIAYLCDGQDIQKHIELANPQKILQGILPQKIDKPAPTVINVLRQERAPRKIKEDAYALQN